MGEGWASVNQKPFEIGQAFDKATADALGYLKIIEDKSLIEMMRANASMILHTLERLENGSSRI